MAAETSLVVSNAKLQSDWEAPQLTASQLHRLSRHIRALSELSRQLRAVRNGYQVTSSEHLAELAFQDSAEPKYVKSGRSRSARPPSKPKAGPRKRRRKISEPEEEPDAAEDSEEAGSGSEEEALDIASDAPDTEPSEAGSEPDAGSEPKPSPKQQKPKAARKTGRHAVKAGRKAKQKHSEDDNSEDLEIGLPEARDETASRPAQLVCLKATPCVPREQELCDVCGSGEGWDGNAILLCDGPGCKVALHQHCCGVSEIPEGDWLCDSCAAGVLPEAHMCLLCPVSGGALRRVEGTGPVKLPSEITSSHGAWVHLACAIWTPEVYFEQATELQGMRLDHLTADRMELHCGICKQGGGSTVQCCFGKCTRALHILCARQHCNVVTLRAADVMLLCFCEMHSKERFAKTREQMIGEVPEGQEDVSALPEEAAPAEPNAYEAQRARNIARIALRLAELQKS